MWRLKAVVNPSKFASTKHFDVYVFKLGSKYASLQQERNDLQHAQKKLQRERDDLQSQLERQRELFNENQVKLQRLEGQRELFNANHDELERERNDLQGQLLRERGMRNVALFASAGASAVAAFISFVCSRRSPAPPALPAPTSPPVPPEQERIVAPQEPSQRRGAKASSLRWGAYAAASKAGRRNFFEIGWEPKRTTTEAIREFDVFEDHQISELFRWAEKKFERLKCTKNHAAILRSYTAESGLYAELTLTCRTDGEESESKLKSYGDYIDLLDEAAGNLQSHLGRCYRGINKRVIADSYAVGSWVTWQGPSSASQDPMVPLDFVDRVGNKLTGTYFVIDSTSGKKLHEFSQFPNEMEVFFRTNSFFKVCHRLEAELDKRERVPELALYDVTNLDVYVLEQERER